MAVHRSSKNESTWKRLTPGIDGDKGSYSRALTLTLTSKKHAREWLSRSRRHPFEADVKTFLKTDLFLVSLFFMK